MLSLTKTCLYYLLLHQVIRYGGRLEHIEEAAEGGSLPSKIGGKELVMGQRKLKTLFLLYQSSEFNERRQSRFRLYLR